VAQMGEVEYSRNSDLQSINIIINTCGPKCGLKIIRLSIMTLVVNKLQPSNNTLYLY
jgi:hypothetical protein